MTEEFWRKVVSVLSGTIVAQLIPILGTLIIARQVSPADFGIFSAWFSLVLCLAIILTGRFETVLAIEADGEPRRSAVLSTLFTTLLLSALIFFILLAVYCLFKPGWLSVLPIPMLIIIVPVAMLVAIAQIWQSWAAAEGYYRKLTALRVTQAAGITFFQIAGGYIHPSASTLATGYFCGVTLGVIISIYLLPIKFRQAESISSIIKRFWKRHWRFPAFSLPADTVSSAAAQIPVILIANKFGAEIAGLMALTTRTLGAPIGILGKSVLDVFKRYAAGHFREFGECREYYIKTFKVLMLGSLAFGVFMIFFSEKLFLIAFGEKWRQAGIIAIWLLPVFLLRFIASPLSYMVYIAGKQHLDLLWQSSLLAITLVCLLTPSHYSTAIQLYSLGYSFLYVIYLLMSYKFSTGVKI